MRYHWGVRDGDRNGRKGGRNAGKAKRTPKTNKRNNLYNLKKGYTKCMCKEDQQEIRNVT